MRTMILAFDALEYNLVERWGMSVLKQRKYGRYRASVSLKYGKPHTPSAWTTIITGKQPEEHGVDDWWTYGRLLDRLRTKPPFVWIKNKRRILWALGLKPRLPNKRDIPVKTIFDLAEKPLPLFIPAYNEPVWSHEKLNTALSKGLDEYKRTIWEIHEYREKTFYHEVNDRDWDLAMAWFDLADLLGHICIVKCRHELYSAYKRLSKIVTWANREFGSDTFILVLSDHGMEPQPDGTGDHSKYGFWSINRDYDWFNPKKAVDFYPLIREVLKK